MHAHDKFQLTAKWQHTTTSALPVRRYFRQRQTHFITTVEIWGAGLACIQVHRSEALARHERAELTGRGVSTGVGDVRKGISAVLTRSNRIISALGARAI